MNKMSLSDDEKIQMRVSIYSKALNNPKGFIPDYLLLFKKDVKILALLAMKRKVVKCINKTVESEYIFNELSKLLSDSDGLKDYNSHVEVLKTGLFNDHLLYVSNNKPGLMLHRASVNLLMTGNNVAMVALLPDNSATEMGNSLLSTKHFVHPSKKNEMFSNGATKPSSNVLAMKANLEKRRKELELPSKIYDVRFPDTASMEASVAWDILHNAVTAYVNNYSFKNSNCLEDLLLTGIFSHSTFIVPANFQCTELITASKKLTKQGRKVVKFMQ